MLSKHKIKDLITLIENSDVSEVKLSFFWGFKRLRISKNSSANIHRQIASPNAVNVSPPVNQSEKMAPVEPIKSSLTELNIKAPLVGTFYSASKPGEPPYVKVGDVVSVGQVVCIIEAMKIFNEIESDVSGRISQILVQNEQPVEFDQSLFIVDPV